MPLHLCSAPLQELGAQPLAQGGRWASGGGPCFSHVFLLVHSCTRWRRCCCTLVPCSSTVWPTRPQCSPSRPLRCPGPFRVHESHLPPPCFSCLLHASAWPWSLVEDCAGSDVPVAQQPLLLGAGSLELPFWKRLCLLVAGHPVLAARLIRAERVAGASTRPSSAVSTGVESDRAEQSWGV